MYPTLSEVLKYRYITRIALAIIGALLALIGTLPLISWILEGTRDLDLFHWSYYAFRIVFGFGLIVVGGLCLLLRTPLAAILAPLPKPLCPRCGYNVSRSPSHICPECGLVFPPEWRSQDAAEVKVPPRVGD